MLRQYKTNFEGLALVEVSANSGTFRDITPPPTETQPGQGTTFRVCLGHSRTVGNYVQFHAALHYNHNSNCT